MVTLSYDVIDVETLLEEITRHPSYRPEINSEAEAISALKGFAPYTYMTRKGSEYLSFYVSYVTNQHTIKSEKFIVDPDKLQYQFWNSSGNGIKIPYLNHPNPYFMKYFSDLDDLIFLAALRCEKYKAETLV